jgi:GDP-L-fucose synthase
MKVLVTGGNGFLGKGVVNKLLNNNYEIKVVRSSKTNLIVKEQVDHLFESYNPDAVIHLAATVGGIGANMANPGKFFYDNMMMGLNIIHASSIWNVKKFVMVGTVCSYPKYCPVPFKESDLWNGYPEETNAPYGISKKALYVMLDSYKKQYNLNSTVLVPCNLYGPNDNFNPSSSHVIPALIKKVVEAQHNDSPSVSCWGSGNATREFLYVDDAAEAIVSSLNIDTQPNPINLGGGVEISIKDLMQKIVGLIGYKGEIIWDASKPDGQPRRFLDTTLAETVLGWKAKTKFDDGLKTTITWYLNNVWNRSL